MATAQKVMQFRLKAEDKEQIERGATLSGVNMSQFMLRAALVEAQHVEADRTQFVIDKNRFNAFMQALDAPPIPSQALNKLLHTAAPWD